MAVVVPAFTGTDRPLSRAESTNGSTGARNSGRDYGDRGVKTDLVAVLVGM